MQQIDILKQQIAEVTEQKKEIDNYLKVLLSDYKELSYITYSNKVLNALESIKKVNFKQIKQKTRTYNIVEARHLYIYFMINKGFKKTEVAAFIDRDRITIHHAYNKIKNFLDVEDALTIQDIKEIEWKIQKTGKYGM